MKEKGPIGKREKKHHTFASANFQIQNVKKPTQDGRESGDGEVERDKKRAENELHHII